MWWINKFGTPTGPYSDEQIKGLVASGQIGSLHRLSTDRRNWQYAKDTAFWKRPEEPKKSAVPTAGGGGQYYGGSESIPIPKPSRVAKQAEISSTSNGNTKTLALVLTGAGFLIAMVFISVVGLIIYGHKAKNSSGTESSLVVEKPNSGENYSSGANGSKGASDIAGIDFNSVKRRVVLIRCKEGVGTGFLAKIDGKTYLMTNEHVVRSVSEPEATLVDGTRIHLGKFSIAKDRDLARFEVDNAKDWYEIANDAPNNEDSVWVFGNSAGDGVITTLKGCVTGVGDVWLKTDAQFVSGNSGSPIVGSDGRVLAVAAFGKKGSDGTDWTVRDTEFDKVRRFGIRLNNVQWTVVDRKKFEAECAAFESFKAYCALLEPYLICLDVSDEVYAELKLEQKEIDRGRFGDDSFGYHEMLCDLTRSWSGLNSIWTKRKSFSSEVKDKYREFLAKRKEALFLARQALQSRDWLDPLMKNGYSPDDKVGCIEWYLNGIKSCIDKNSQDLKDLNKRLKKLEGEDDDE